MEYGNAVFSQGILNRVEKSGNFTEKYWSFNWNKWQTRAIHGVPLRGE